MNATCMEKVSRSKKVMKSTPLFDNNEEGPNLSFCKDIYLFIYVSFS